MAERFRRNRLRDRAAMLVARGGLPDAEIARQLGVSAPSIWKWKQREDFQRWVDDYLVDWRRELSQIGLASKEARLAFLSDRHARMTQLLEERANDPSLEGVPGGSTGLLTRQIKIIGTGQSAQIVFEYTFDAALVRELREHERQAAQELGEWTERREITGRDGGPVAQEVTTRVVMDISRLTDQELDVLEQALLRLSLNQSAD